ncbi:hypothetical protein K6119_12310 [Paracrocinitomix mangrovi]|nr:hypothetical protein [Paracrocinitomix mangrovi]UKN00515.1 hypothetical protein K6119_12310 [Paracrocinitomix mangrovi]
MLDRNITLSTDACSEHQFVSSVFSGIISVHTRLRSLIVALLAIDLLSL